jgi:serine/threonine protein kinase
VGLLTFLQTSTFMLPNPSAILSNTFKVLRKHELIPRLLKPSRGIFFQRKQAFLKYRKNAEAGASSSEVHATDEDEDDLRIGLVFEKSVGPNDEAEIISLLELFNWVKKPSLTDCIALAKSIATNLYYLHAVDWLHKGLRSENILLLWGSNSIFRFDHTYMMGFEFSRPAWPDDATEIPKNESKYEVYKHPRAQSGCVVRRRFRKEFDIYSLSTQTNPLLPVSVFRRLTNL